MGDLKTNMNRIFIIILGCFLCISCQKTIDTKQIYTHKVWLHRANDIAKAQKFQYKYEGLEIDVYFDDSLHSFIIKHDFGNPQKDATNPGYEISQWADSLSNIENIGLWLDFKNLSDSNKNAALKKLIELRKQYNLKGKIYVESNNFNCLPIFVDEDFAVSYYIPYFSLPLDSIKENRIATEINQAIHQTGITTISGYDYQYEFMKKHFPSLRKLLWVTSFEESQQEKGLTILKQDTLVDILLLADK